MKFVVLPHNGSVICSISFTAPYGLDMISTKLSFTLYAKRNKLERIVAIYRLVEDKLMYLALVARALYVRCPHCAVERLNDEVCRAIWLLDSAARFPGFTTMTPDRFGAELSAAATVFGRDFVSRAVTSHLSTRGYTVVVAPDQTTLRVMTYVLATFLDARDLALSLPSVDRYCPGLVLQGIVGTLESAGVDEEQLLQAPLPTTVIDLSSPVISVKHPKGLKMYNDERKEYFQCIITILTSKGTPGEKPLFSNLRSPTTTTIANLTYGGSTGGSVLGSVVTASRQVPHTSIAGTRKLSSLAGSSVPSLSSLERMPPAASGSADPLPPMARQATPTGDVSLKQLPPPQSSPPPQAQHQQGAKALQQENGIFLSVKESSKLVDDIISQALCLPLHLRQSYVKHSCNLLTYKAVSYLKLFASDM